MCECDNHKGYWYKCIPSQDISREYYICNLAECPSERAYYINRTNECISNCSDMGLNEYSSICYDQCPLLTKETKTKHIRIF
jgi:hypothetical protein